MKKSVLILCETSGALRRRFARRGWKAWSNDVLPRQDGQSGEGVHVMGDALRLLRNLQTNSFDMVIGHPPCTYLAGSGMHWTTRGLRDPKLTEHAIRFAEEMWTEAKRVAKHVVVLENPVGVLSTRSKLGKPAQYVQPYQFGDDASKRTGLWIAGRACPLLTPTKEVAPRIVDGKKRWSNQTDSGQNKLAPSADRWQKRSATFNGIADAIVDQIGGYVEGLA